MLRWDHGGPRHQLVKGRNVGLSHDTMGKAGSWCELGSASYDMRDEPDEETVSLCYGILGEGEAESLRRDVEKREGQVTTT